MKEFQITSADGLLLQGKHWTSKIPAKAVIQLSHGMAEHIDRYDGFARFLADRGYEVYGHSHRGHGKTAKSSEDLGYLAQNGGWDLLVDDLIDITKMIKDNSPDLPIIILGHSMGSFAARNALRREAQLYDGAVIMGSGWQSQVTIRLAQAVSWVSKLIIGAKKRSKLMDVILFGSYNDKIVDSTTTFDWLTRDTEMVRKYIDDPYCGFVCTSSFYSDLIKGVGIVMKRSGLDLIPKDFPILVASGDDDPVGGHGKGSKALYKNYEKNGFSNVSLKLYKDGRHEILNEINRIDVYEDIVKWVDSII